MQHRHLTADEPTVAVIDAYLERGSHRDFRELLRRIQRDPYGPWAEAAEQAAARNDEVYRGKTELIKLVVARWRADALARRRSE